MLILFLIRISHIRFLHKLILEVFHEHFCGFLEDDETVRRLHGEVREAMRAIIRKFRQQFKHHQRHLVIRHKHLHDLIQKAKDERREPVVVQLEIFRAGHALSDPQEDVHVAHQLEQGLAFLEELLRRRLDRLRQRRLELLETGTELRLLPRELVYPEDCQDFVELA